MMEAGNGLVKASPFVFSEPTDPGIEQVQLRNVAKTEHLGLNL
jgi:hypothetical protein